MFLFFILMFIAVIFWIISIIFNDIEDGLQYYYDVSIFDWLPKDGWWSWYMLDPDDTWKRKYINFNIEDGFKKWMGLRIPAFIYDGWHGAKILRQFFQYLTSFTTFVAGYVFIINIGFPEWLLLFIIGLCIWGITNYVTHTKYVFDGMIKKHWWIKRNLDQQLKEFLNKHF